MTFVQLKVFTTTGLVEQLVACFKAFWQSTAAELFRHAIEFQSNSQPFEKQRLEFTFETLSFSDPAGESQGLTLAPGLTTLVLG